MYLPSLRLSEPPPLNVPSNAVDFLVAYILGAQPSLGRIPKGRDSQNSDCWGQAAGWIARMNPGRSDQEVRGLMLIALSHASQWASTLARWYCLPGLQMPAKVQALPARDRRFLRLHYE